MSAPRAYYNEVDAYAAQWLRNLIAAGHITAGDVDTRSIVDVRPDDLVGYDRCHFFAGIGVWDYALGLAGWPTERPVWTGSCPCQPFSAAGKGGRVSDERHLWPAFFHLIEQCRPATVLGEQVASKDGLDWFDLVQADLEGSSYDVAAADLCAAGVGAPNIRQRLWWVAYAIREWVRSPRPCATDATPRGMQSAHGERERVWANSRAGRLVVVHGLGDAACIEHKEYRSGGVHPKEAASSARVSSRDGASGSGSNGGFWSDADWLPCRAPERGIVYRPVESGTFPLAHGDTSRVGRLRAYGNAINAEAARVFVSAVMEVRP